MNEEPTNNISPDKLEIISFEDDTLLLVFYENEITLKVLITNDQLDELTNELFKRYTNDFGKFNYIVSFSEFDTSITFTEDLMFEMLDKMDELGLIPDEEELETIEKNT